MENGALKKETFYTKRANEHLRSDITNLKRMMAELLTAVETLKGQQKK